MRSYATVLNTLDQSDPQEVRLYFTNFLSELLPVLKSGEQPATEIAYIIAGILASSFARTLDDNDPISA
jgi:hypothetical protein